MFRIFQASSLLASEAGERALVGRVEVGAGSRSSLAAATTGTTELAAGSTTATAAATGTITTGTTAGATTAATGTTSGVGGLDKALVDLDDLLDLALTLALGLATGGGEVVLTILLGEGLGVGPLLVLLNALVGLAESESSLGLESRLLLGLLDEVIGVGDVLVLLLLLNGGGGGSIAFDGGLLLLGLSELLAGLLVLQLGLALVGAPCLSSGLVRATAEMMLVYWVVWRGVLVELTRGDPCCDARPRDGRV